MQKESKNESERCKGNRGIVNSYPRKFGGDKEKGKCRKLQKVHTGGEKFLAEKTNHLRNDSEQA